MHLILRILLNSLLKTLYFLIELVDLQREFSLLIQLVRDVLIEHGEDLGVMLGLLTRVLEWRETVWRGAILLQLIATVKLGQHG